MYLNESIFDLSESKGLLIKSSRDNILKECDENNELLSDYLLRKEKTDEQKILPILSRVFYDIPYFPDITVLSPSSSYIDKFDIDELIACQALPISIERNTLRLALTNPLNSDAISYVRSIYHGELSIVLTSQKAIEEYLSRLKQIQSMNKAFSDISEQNGDRVVEDKIQEVTGTDAPIVQLVDAIIKEAIPLRASDIHFEPWDKTVGVRFRIDGDLVNYREFNIADYQQVSSRIKNLAGLNISERRKPQDGKLQVRYGDTVYSYRVSTCPTIRDAEKIVLRRLDGSLFTKSRAELGFQPEANGMIDKMLAKPHGVVLLTGPTGCGKTTTLYSFLRELNREEVNICTAEDPVEYNIDGITQVQVNGLTGMTFADALRSFLRQDPDIMLVGEIRDGETAEMAIRSAMTGHQVFSTLHTNDAISAVDRLVDLGTSPYLIADTLTGVISQRLIKRVCPKCRTIHYATDDEMKILGVTSTVSLATATPGGCSYCNHTGYYGRMAIHEIFVNTEKTKELIAKRVPAEVLREEAKKGGMRAMRLSCRAAVLNGDAPISEYMKYLND